MNCSFHSRASRINILVVGAASLLFLFAGQSAAPAAHAGAPAAQAGSPAAHTGSPSTIERSSYQLFNDWPLAPEGEALKEKPQHCRIYQIDLQALGDRQPFLLIHGGGSEHLKLFHWEKVIERFNQD